MLFLSLPVVYSLELTSGCNNGCPVCFQQDASQRRETALAATTWLKFLDQIGPEAVRIRLTGGEPTLHPQFEQILSAACSFDAQVTIFTNARWQHPEKLLNCLGKADNLAGLLVSLHGAQPATHDAFTQSPGSFTETLRNIRRARSRGIPVALSTVITRQNLEELEEVVELGEQLGVEYIAFNRNLGPSLSDSALTKQEFRIAVRRIEAMVRAGKRITYGTCLPQCLRQNSGDGCLAGITMLTVGSTGEARPCVYAQKQMGNVFHRGLTAVWNSSAMTAWRSDEPEQCATCAAYPVCHGGCRAARERFASGDPLMYTPCRRYTVRRFVRPLPENGNPVHSLRIRPEPFGYSLLGNGQVWPVPAHALHILSACNGESTLSDLRSMFDAADMELIEELWNAGVIEILPGI